MHIEQKDLLHCYMTMEQRRDGFVSTLTNRVTEKLITLSFDWGKEKGLLQCQMTGKQRRIYYCCMTGKQRRVSKKVAQLWNRDKFITLSYDWEKLKGLLQ